MEPTDQLATVTPSRPRRSRWRLGVWAVLMIALLVAGLLLGRRPPVEIREIARLSAHTKGVMALAFSPGGSLLASGSEDGTIKLWTPSTHQPLTTLDGPAESITALAFSPDGKLLASTAANGLVQLWNALTATSLGTLQGHTHPVKALAFSPDGKYLASAGGGFDRHGRDLPGELLIWELSSHQQHARLEGHTGVIFTLAYSPDGKLLASGSNDDTVKLWDMPSGRRRSTLKAHDAYVASLTFSADGRLLISGGNDEQVGVWDVETNQLQRTLAVHSPVCSLSFVGRTPLLAIGDADGMLQLWDVSTGTPQTSLEAHPAAVTALAFAPPLEMLATGADGTNFQGMPIAGEIKLWQLPAPRTR